MEAFKTVIWIINIFSSLTIIALVLMQHGKGADAGASFGGSGSAQGVFGSSGNANFLTRMTAITAIIFFASCLALGYVNTKSTSKVGSVDFSTVQQSHAASDVQQPTHAQTASQETSNLKAATAAATATTVAKVITDKAKKTSSTTSAEKTDKKVSNKDKKVSDKKSDTHKSKKTSEKNQSSTKTDKKKQ